MKEEIEAKMTSKKLLKKKEIIALIWVVLLIKINREHLKQSNN